MKKKQYITHEIKKNKQKICVNLHCYCGIGEESLIILL